MRRAPRRHPLEVTADRLKDQYERYYNELRDFDRSVLDDISHVIYVLDTIAERSGHD